MPLRNMLFQRLVSWVARSQGFLDPVEVWAQLRRFGRPSEVIAPTELLRSGAVLHARGLVNSQAIQHNLDWIWPHWVVRQFDPSDPAFIPRAFSLTHINLTHRNWTAVGLPDMDELPIVDPRGLLTPHYDGWSLEGWLVQANGQPLVPARARQADQQLLWETGLTVRTRVEAGGQSLTASAATILQDDQPVCRLQLQARASGRAWLVLALRPYNPEGISFIHQIANLTGARGWLVNRKRLVCWDAPADQILFSRYAAGDVYYRLTPSEAPPQPRPDEAVPEDAQSIEDDVGMATAAAMFALPASGSRSVTVEIPLREKLEPTSRTVSLRAPEPAWNEALSGACRLEGADPQWQYLYDASLRALVLHTPGDVYPGPYTYKRFWFRDAAFIIHALACMGLLDRAEKALDQFPPKQTPNGYFRSQKGEWDSNGQALWVMHRFCELSGRPPKPAWQKPIEKGGAWIERARLPDNSRDLHAGLLPAGFSAEHFGPNDYYYWDDYWGVAGLRSAASMLESVGRPKSAAVFREHAASLMRSIERSLDQVEELLGHRAMPISPYRRMDAAAIGMLCASYPLQLVPPDDARMHATMEFLLANCLVDGGFFQNMSHSGINPYLTLHLAQTALRAGDRRWAWDLTQTIVRLASPTGQWPEAVHPGTKGGCMGDGQHIWAVAEWLLMVRNCFVQEEGDRLILCAGIPETWLARPGPIRFGPAPTRYGPVSLTITTDALRPKVEWSGTWHGPEPTVEVRL
jgi:hypothetical protein